LGAAHRENERAVLLPGFGPNVGSEADGEWTLQPIKSALVAGFLRSLFPVWKAKLKLLNAFIHIWTWNLSAYAQPMNTAQLLKVWSGKNLNSQVC